MKNLVLLLLFVVSIIACDKKDDFIAEIILSQKNIQLEDGASTEIVSIKANTNRWMVTSNQTWCTVDKDKNDNLRIKTTANTQLEKRKATVNFLVNDKVCQTLGITQVGLNSIIINEITVIYTILQTPSERGVRLPAGTIERNFDVLRRFYRNQYAPNRSVDIRIDFKLATTDPQGNVLETPGVRYFEIPQPINNYYTLLDKPIANYPDGIQWNPNKYINIYIYDDDIDGLQGVSVLPFTPENNPLAGLTASDYYFYKPAKNFRFLVIDLPHLVNHPEATTIAHEMGHYLGVFHAFSEDGCNENDYCDDTPNYNRSQYNWYRDGYSRTSCSGMVFESRNVMDYELSYADLFTPNQNARMQHVLKHSPLIPRKNQVQALYTGEYMGEEPKAQAIQ